MIQERLVEDRSLLARVRRGDARAEAQIVRQGEQYAGWVCARFLATHPVLDEEDLRQVARIALLRAARGWRPEAGVAFITYLYHAIWNTLRREWSRQSSHQFVDVGDVALQVVSLDSPMIGSSDPSDLDLQIDFLEAPDEIAPRLDRIVLWEWVTRVLAEHPCDLKVLALRFGLGGERPHRNVEVAAMLGCSPARACRLTERAIHKLRCDPRCWEVVGG